MKNMKLQNTTAENSFRYGWLLSRIMPFVLKYWFRIFLGILVAIPLGLLDGVTAFSLKPYMDYVVNANDFCFSILNHKFCITSIQIAVIIPFCVIIFAALQGILKYLNGYFCTWTGQKITNDLKIALFKKLVNMHPQFFDENTSGVVIQRYMTDPMLASTGIVNELKDFITGAFGAIGLIAVMLYSSWKLAIIGVVVLITAFVPVFLIRKKIKSASNQNMVVAGNMTTNFNETYSGNKVVAAYQLQKRQYDCFRNQVLESFHINMSLYKRTGWMSPIMYIIASFGIATVLGVGTYLINSNQMTAGSFASFVTSLLLLYKPVKVVGGSLTELQTLLVAAGRVFELFDLDSQIENSPKALELIGFEHEIRFNNVYFAYEANHSVLKNINLTVQKNESIAIVGNSGGGKSTLVNLIPRFYNLQSGTITIDGVNIADISLKSLRSNISIVFQDNFLFTGTIKDNIMMGNPHATEKDLIEALQSAYLVELINELPNGINTIIGERGTSLSGGQRQRVAIARAIIKNAPIVILDEATSALDNESEKIVQHALSNLMKNKTVFIIAHRLSTIVNADRIIVINNGEIVEQGTHEKLIGIKDGHYKMLYEMQFKKHSEQIL